MFATKSVKSPQSDNWVVEIDANYGVVKPPKPISAAAQNILDELYLKFKFAQTNAFVKVIIEFAQFNVLQKSSFPFQETLVLFQKRGNKFPTGRANKKSITNPSGIFNEVTNLLDQKKIKYIIRSSHFPII